MDALVIRDILIKRGEELLAQPFKPVPFTANPDADALLNDLDHYPHAFVFACLMNRQWKAEKCWSAPFRFQERLGSFEFDALAALSREEVVSLFVRHPPLHRMKEKMAEIFYLAVHKVKEQYSGDASRIWRGEPGSATIVRRFLEFKGAGPKIATVAANFLVRDFKVPVRDKYSIDLSVDVQVCRTFERLGLVRQGASKDELIYVARELNPAYPGVFDLPAWEIGRNWCRPKSPECAECYMRVECPSAQEMIV